MIGCSGIPVIGCAGISPDRVIGIGGRVNGNTQLAILSFSQGFKSFKVCRWVPFRKNIEIRCCKQRSKLRCSTVFGFIGFAMFMMPSFIKPLTLIQAFTFYGIGTFFCGNGYIFSLQTFPLYSAKLIKSELENLITGQSSGLGLALKHHHDKETNVATK